MFKHTYTQEQSKHKITICYSNWLDSSENSSCNTTIENEDLQKVKGKFISILISFIGGTLDSFVLRYQKGTYNLSHGCDTLDSIEARNRLVMINSVKRKYYDLNSFYKQGLLLVSWECYFKDSIKFLKVKDQEQLYSNLKDIQKATNLLAKSINPKTTLKLAQ